MSTETKARAALLAAIEKHVADQVRQRREFFAGKIKGDNIELCHGKRLQTYEPPEPPAFDPQHSGTAGSVRDNFTELAPGSYAYSPRWEPVAFIAACVTPWAFLYWIIWG